MKCTIEQCELIKQLGLCGPSHPNGRRSSERFWKFKIFLQGVREVNKRNLLNIMWPRIEKITLVVI